ncbi:hypothetical protein [Roseiarcus sp.]|uniref:hypothetical protein n=1 Tax=Roseiarcus sp. TaxID=1969460 RepID=UPI003F990CAC
MIQIKALTPKLMIPGKEQERTAAELAAVVDNRWRFASFVVARVRAANAPHGRKSMPRFVGLSV